MYLAFHTPLLQFGIVFGKLLKCVVVSGSFEISAESSVFQKQTHTGFSFFFAFACSTNLKPKLGITGITIAINSCLC